jgi:hypothetical protein
MRARSIAASISAVFFRASEFHRDDMAVSAEKPLTS